MEYNMKRFYYIDENEQEQLDLVWLFEHATNYKLNSLEVEDMLVELNKYIKIN